MQTYLHLADGEVIKGEQFGYPVESEGEVVFTTGMTGYVESLTDPSFAGQILVFTYPLVGNYGVPRPVSLAKHLMGNMESERIWVKGVVIANLTIEPSHYDVFKSFDAWLKLHKIPGIFGVDTRALTHKLREYGVMKGKISFSKNAIFSEKKEQHWVSIVSCKEIIRYNPISANYSLSEESKKRVEGLFFGKPSTSSGNKKTHKHIALIDCGVKHGILRELLQLGFTVTRVPWNINPLSLNTKFDAVVCSNGPGDPKDCDVTINHVREILKVHIPYIGVCLGHQLLGLAIGADTYKLPYGHRGLNQPCQDTFTKKAYVTSQNHGYAVKPDTLPKGFSEWFINLNDGTNEGIINEKQKVWSSQFHPEGNPGPFDTKWIFGLIQ